MSFAALGITRTLLSHELYGDLSQVTVIVIFLFIVNQHSNEETWLWKTLKKSFKADYFTVDYICKLDSRCSWSITFKSLFGPQIHDRKNL